MLDAQRVFVAHPIQDANDEEMRAKADAVVDDRAPLRDAPMVALSEIGYDTETQTDETIVSAFQRRYRPTRFDGTLDDETRMRIAQVHALVAASAGSA